MGLVFATVGTILSGGTLSSAIATGGLISLGTVTATGGFIISLDEFTGIGNEETWLESEIRSNLGDKSADLFKGAKLIFDIKGAVRGKANFTVKLAGGEMIDGTYDVINQTYSIGGVVKHFTLDQKSEEKEN